MAHPPFGMPLPCEPNMVGSKLFPPKVSRVHPYTKSLEGNVSGLRIGMVKEGFGHSSSEKDVDTKVQKAAQLLTKLGATVEEVSIPMHLLGGALWLPIGIEGLQGDLTDERDRCVDDRMTRVVLCGDQLY